MSAADGYEQSPSDCDLVLSTPYDPCLGSFEINRIAHRARWKSNPDVVVMVAAQSTMQDPAWSSLPGATLINDVEALRAVVPDPRYLVALQGTPVEDRLVTFLTWTDASWDFTREHGYLVVQAADGRGDLYHPPVTRVEFLRAVVTLNNYLAAGITREEVEGYPQQFDSAEIDASVRSEIVSSELGATDNPDDIVDFCECDLEDLD
jgi:hypothetical protein